MSWVFIQPTDVWVFRDGRPFVAGEGHTVGTMFPPTPFTVQGALRALILGHDAVDWREFHAQESKAAIEMGKQIGYPRQEKNGVETRAAEVGKFAMNGPFLGQWLPKEKKAEPLAQRPLDSYLYDNTPDREIWDVLRPEKVSHQWTEWPDDAPLFPLLPREHMEKLEETEHPYLLDALGLSLYLEEEPFQMSNTAAFVPESRLGIALDYGRRRPKDRMIYSLDYRRPSVARLGTDAEPGLLVKLGDGVKLPQKEGVLALGGEARAAHYRLLKEAEAPEFPQSQPAKQLKILLLTPAWFSDGWQPEDGDWGPLLGNATGLRLVAAAVGRAQYLGGWNVATNWHKPMRAFVPAGSVFFFEADEPITPPTALSETPEEQLYFVEKGFGACVCGQWSWL